MIRCVQKFSPKLACTVLLLVAMPVVWASGSGVLTVRAKITSATCSIGVNGKSSPVINLPDIATGDFKDVTSTYKNTRFTIDLSGCDDVADGSLLITVTRPAGGEEGNSDIPAISGTAKDSVKFRLLRTEGSPSWFFTGTTATFTAPALTSGVTSIPYLVGYRAVKLPVSGGTISSIFSVTLSYK